MDEPQLLIDLHKDAETVHALDLYERYMAHVSYGVYVARKLG